jgi:hypothetical protein
MTENTKTRRGDNMTIGLEHLAMAMAISSEKNCEMNKLKYEMT